MKNGICTHLLHIFLTWMTALACPLAGMAQDVRVYRDGIDFRSAQTFCQDKNGYLWIGTNYGLFRFDGVDFKPYLHEDGVEGSLSDNNINVLYRDDNDRLWVGTGNGLQYYRPEADNFQLIATNKEEASTDGYIKSVVKRRNGEVWCVASGLGMLKIDADNNVAARMTDNKAYNGIYVNSVYEDRYGNLWITDTKSKVRRCDTDGKARFFDGVKGALQVLEDRSGRLLVVCEDKVLAWDSAADKLEPLADETPHLAPFTHAIVSDNEIVYLATDGQGLKYIPKGASAIYQAKGFRAGNAATDGARISCLFEDSHHNLWMHSAEQGVMMVSAQPTFFSFWDFSKDGELDGLYAVLKDKEGRVWCSQTSGGVELLANDGSISRHINTPAPVTALGEDAAGRLWAGSLGGDLYLISKESLDIARKVALPYKSKVTCITLGKGDNIYVSVFGEGFVRYNTTNGDMKAISMETPGTVGNHMGVMVNNWITSLKLDAKERLWMGHYGGVSCFNTKTERFIDVHKVLGLGTSICHALLEAKDGTVWLGTNIGLYALTDGDPNRVQRWTTTNGLSDGMICALAEDEQGNVWCSTMRGINRIDPKSGETVHYYMGNGLRDKVYKAGVCCKADDGTVLFGGMMGITWFDPGMVGSGSLKGAEVYITDMVVRETHVTQQSLSDGHNIIDRELVEADRLTLSCNDNTFALKVSTMDFRENSNVVYQYRLTEYGDEWTSTEPGENVIRYHHLRHGDYTLEVRAVENGELSTTRQIRIHILPPWYLTWWAKTLYLLLAAAAMLYAWWSIRRRQRERQNEDRLSLFTAIAHEIRSPMTLVISPIETLMKRAGGDPVMRHELNTMHRNASRILSLMNQLLDIRSIDNGRLHLRAERIDLVSFVHDTLDAFSHKAGSMNVRLHAEHDKQEMYAWIDPGNFDKVLVNLVTNAFKYTPQGGEITVQLSEGPNGSGANALPQNWVEMKVMDTGPGIQKKQMDRVFDLFYKGSDSDGFGIGLNLCKSLVRLHHGTITASNRTDTTGACFTVRIPALALQREANDDTVSAEETAITAVRPDPTAFLAGETEKTTGRHNVYSKVLVVDDDDEVRRYLQAELSSRFKVMVASNGEEGLRMAVEKQPDAIISDVIMAKMDGLTMLRKLKAGINTNHIPVILLSSRKELPDRIEGLNQGADGYLAKPFRIEELKAMVVNVIASRTLLRGKYSGAQEQEGRVKPVEMTNVDDQLLERVMTFINDNMSNSDINMEMLAAEVGLSRVHLYRKIKELTGATPGQFLRNLRLKEAAKLLKARNSNIAQVAYAVGFTNQNHFSTCFKSVYGVTPTEYIKQSLDPARSMEGEHHHACP